MFIFTVSPALKFDSIDISSAIAIAIVSNSNILEIAFVNYFLWQIVKLSINELSFKLSAVFD